MANHKYGPWSLEDVRRIMGAANPKLPFDDAVRYDVWFGSNQLARLDAARTAIARVEGRP